jgi:hypothetical protein
MNDVLTSDRLSRQALGEERNPQQSSTAIPRIIAFGFIGCFLAAAAALWVRFGETVFTSSMLNAILACF